MLKLPEAKFPFARTGDSVTVQVTDVGRSPRSMLNVIIQVNEHNCYKLGSERGASKNLFHCCHQVTTSSICFCWREIPLRGGRTITIYQTLMCKNVFQTSVNVKEMNIYAIQILQYFNLLQRLSLWIDF